MAVPILRNKHTGWPRRPVLASCGIRQAKGKQTIRAAFGLMHDNTELFYPERWTTNPPYASQVITG